ncbi:glycosyltransferase family 39 protein [Comamonas sp. JUb58]|uniref:glycosyltransferase family 39 protein n=1 Tax=Comamonas sp. JUb58 TaxID=2485114 RepID=UPI00106025C9|nr:glycosyltransferase family 39 protein [Comamonas sp. JUb58]
MTPPSPPSPALDRQALRWIAVLFVLVMASRLLASHGVSWDQNEQLVWSQQLALGYGPQPPLYTWLQWALVGVLGPSTLAVVLLKNSLIALSFFFMLLAARQVLPARQTWLAAAGMTWLPGIAWQLLRDQTHTVMLTCAICATWWLLLRQLRHPRPLGFVYLGLVVAWGMLSKYSYLLVAVTMLLACLSMASTRRALLSRGWWITPLISIALVAPHAWWVLEHWQAASGATLDKLHPAETSSYLSGLAHGLRDLLAFLLVAVLPWLLMARWTSGRFWQQPAAASGAENNSPTPDWLVPLLGRYMALVAGSLALMALAGAAKFDGRWIQPLLLVFPLYILARWPALAQSDTSRRRYLLACLGMLVLVWSLALLAPLRDAKRGKGDRLNWQLDLIASTLRQAGYQGQGMVLAEHHTTGGVMRILFPQAKIVVCDADEPGFHMDCAWQAAESARRQHLPWLQISTEDPAPDAWWWAAWPVDAMLQVQEVELPYRWTDPAIEQMQMNFVVSPAGR